MSRPLTPDPAAGVFETLLVSDGSPVELDAHLRRLSASTRELYGADPPADTRELALEHAGPLTLGRLRVTVAPAAAGELAAEAATATVERASVFPSWERAVALRGFLVPGGLGAHKWADRTGLASLETDLPDGCIALLLDTGGEVLEASRANVFAVEGDVLVTPPADGRILPGVARTRAIELARSLGVEVREEKLSSERLLAASEAFVSGSVRGIEPVRGLDQSQLEVPGALVREIAAAMEALWIGPAAASTQPRSTTASPG
jgi:para-aminobenzoate synthetase / 4-amino-4-deoxychorismate lyase